MTGWYHPARRRDAGGVRHCGVLLCPPYGHEYMVSYLSYRHLATELASAGFDVLFFDYNNTGDAADHPAAQTGQVALWQTNIRDAAQYLRSLIQSETLVLFGTRLGALLAASVARETGAAALMLLAPVVSGRSYSRELQILSQTGGPASPASHHAGTEQAQVAGYPWNEALRQQISGLDMLNMPAPEIPVLILERDDVTGQEQKILQAWQDTVPLPHLSTTPGYAAMMTADAHETTVPAALWQDILTWLQPQFCLRDTGVASLPAFQTETVLPLPRAAITEKLVKFDDLTGVLSSPASPDTARPAVIIANTGANHRVGNHRLSVQLARELAQAGFTVLRFDKAGIGYSKATPDDLTNQVYAACGLDDLRAAQAFLLHTEQIGTTILCGLCSGAYFASLAAADDPQVRGVVLMNQLVYRWREGDTLESRKNDSIKSTHFYVKAIRSLHTWKRLLRGQIAFRQIVRKLSQRTARRLQLLTQHIITRWIDSPHFLGRIARQFRQMEARGTEILMIMDAADSSVDQMTENFGRHGALLGGSRRIRLEITRNADHTFTPLWSQRYVTQLIASHLSERFGGGAANAAK